LKYITFLDKAGIALELIIEGLQVLGQCRSKYCFRVGCGKEPVLHHSCLHNVIEFS